MSGVQRETKTAHCLLLTTYFPPTHQAATTQTDANGNYSFAGVQAGGSYTVTPSKTGFTFSPPSQSFSSLNGNVFANFVGAYRLQLRCRRPPPPRCNSAPTPTAPTRTPTSARERNPAFVLTECFGYLRRNPDDTPDADFSGFNFWLAKLNQFGGDFRRAEMVGAFLVSTEYRARFGRP